jgi:hypothetical protein
MSLWLQFPAMLAASGLHLRLKVMAIRAKECDVAFATQPVRRPCPVGDTDDVVVFEALVDEAAGLSGFTPALCAVIDSTLNSDTNVGFAPVSFPRHFRRLAAARATIGATMWYIPLPPT